MLLRKYSPQKNKVDILTLFALNCVMPNTLNIWQYFDFVVCLSKKKYNENNSDVLYWWPINELITKVFVYFVMKRNNQKNWMSFVKIKMWKPKK